ncbi:MAG: VWA domain-containing protein [Aliarcobacter sp.]|nr:VWA domain-containing protein [Aliarcobacter sp.]
MENLRLKEVEINYEQRCAVQFVLDKSESMDDKPIRNLNNGVKKLFDEVSNSAKLFNKLDISIIAYDNNIDVVREFSTYEENSEAPVLSAGGTTHTPSALKKAIELVEERKDYYKKNGIPYHRPYIIHLTDGETCGDSLTLEFASDLIKNGEKNKKFTYWGFGVGDDVNMKELETIKGPNSMVLRLQDVDSFEDFFKWLSNSFEQISDTSDGKEADFTPEKNCFKQTVYAGD